MVNKTHVPKINGKIVKGEAHLQPGINHWIGVFVVRNNFFEGELNSWKTVTVEYEGPFNCRDKCVNGRGKAKIIHIRKGKEKNTSVINIEGAGKSKFENEVEKDIRFNYNPNLPVD